jgi:hypothetical protein
MLIQSRSNKVLLSHVVCCMSADCGQGCSWLSQPNQAMARVSRYSLVMPQGRPTAVGAQVPALQATVMLVPWLGLVQVAVHVPPCGIAGQDQVAPGPGVAVGFPVQPGRGAAQHTEPTVNHQP